MENERISLPVVALRGMTILPEMVAHFDVSREKSLQAIDQAMTEGEKIFLTGQYEIETEDPDVTDIHRIGCIATIKQIVKLPKKISRVLVSGEQRAELIDLEFKEHICAERLQCERMWILHGKIPEQNSHRSIWKQWCRDSGIFSKNTWQKIQRLRRNFQIRSIRSQILRKW